MYPMQTLRTLKSPSRLNGLLSNAAKKLSKLLTLCLNKITPSPQGTINKLPRKKSDLESPDALTHHFAFADAPLALQCQDTFSEDTVFDSQGETMFDPRTIRHPCSSECTPPDHIACYTQVWLRRPLDREVRNKLRVECPCPDIPGKVTYTPESDTFMANFMTKQGRDPHRGLKKGLKTVQNILLDLSGPMIHVLMTGNAAVSSNTPLNLQTVKDWNQRMVCLLAFLQNDPRMADMDECELGVKADGKLFGDAFVRELRKHIFSYMDLKKVKISLKNIFPPHGVFSRAGHARGRGASRSSYRGSRTTFTSGPTFQRSTFPQPKGYFRGRSGSSRSHGCSTSGVCDIIYNTEPKGLRDHVVTLHFKTSYGAYQLSYSECPNGVHLEKIGDKQDDRTSLFIQKYCENNTYKFQCEKNENLWLCVKDKQLDLHHFGDPRVEYEFTIHKRV